MNEENKKIRLVNGVFIFNEKNELLLTKSKCFKNKYNVPGGGVKYREKTLEAAYREVEEETGLKLDNIEFVSVTECTKMDDIYTKDFNHLVFLNYYASCSSNCKIKLNQEASGYKWLKVDDWLKRKDVAITIREFLESKQLDDVGLKHKYHRALADYQNLIKRTATEKESFIKYANEQIVLEILPIYDNLKVSLDHIDETAANNGWAEGIKYVVKQFTDVLENIGVKEIEVKGKKFDPNTMEAMEGKGDKVKSLVKPGYKLKGKVIIPARVKL